jgi:hypothetical protein
MTKLKNCYLFGWRSVKRASDFTSPSISSMMTPYSIKRCNAQLPPRWKIVELLCLDGRETIGYWTGKQFLASGSRVSAWGWREVYGLNSSDALRLVEHAIGRRPSAHGAGDNDTHNATAEKPRPFRVVNLQLPNGDEVFGIWDGASYIRRGRTVEPISWTAFRPIDTRTFEQSACRAA